MSTPQYAFVNVAASQTDAVVVPAVAAQVRIRVLGVTFVAGGTATNATFNSKGSGAGTAITCLFANSANGGAVLPVTPASPEESIAPGWFQTLPGQALTVTTGSGSTTGIVLVWTPDTPSWKTP